MYTDRDRSETVCGRVQALTVLDAEFPSVAWTLEYAIADNALRQRPKGMRANIFVGANLLFGSDEDNPRPFVFHPNGGVQGQAGKRIVSVRHTSYAVSPDRVRTENDRAVRCIRQGDAKCAFAKKGEDPRRMARGR